MVKGTPHISTAAVKSLQNLGDLGRHLNAHESCLLQPFLEQAACFIHVHLDGFDNRSGALARQEHGFDFCFGF